MNESTPQEGQKSPWPRRLAMGCGGILVLGLVGLFVLNLIAKRVIAGKIEDEIAKNGWEANVGEFDYSLRNKEIEIHDFKGMPLKRKELERLGEVEVEHARIRFDGERKDKIGEVLLKGATSKIGKIGKLEVKPDQLIEIEGFTINNPAGFGSGPMLDFKKIRIEYAPDSRAGKEHFKEIRLEVARINIVKNKEGKWLTDGAAKAQVQIQEGNDEMPRVDDIAIAIDEIAFQDLRQGGEPRVIKVNKTIQVTDNPEGYGLSLFLRLIGVVASAKSEAGL